MTKIIPNLWFDKEAEAAANFYVGIFKGAGRKSAVNYVRRYSESGAAVSGMPKGSVMTVDFELDGMKFIGINGGPVFKFTEAVSFLISCKDQKEIDYFSEKLGEGGEQGPCGWLKDKYGLSWQIAPGELLEKMAKSGEEKKYEKAMAALFKMKKIDIGELERAYNG